MSRDPRSHRARHRGGAPGDPARRRRRRRRGCRARARPRFPAWRAVAPGDRAALMRSLADDDRGPPRGARACSRPATPARRSATRGARSGWSIETFRYYAGAPERLLGDTIPVAGGQAFTVREPLGVVGLITPWNFPLRSRLEARSGAGGRQHGRAQAGRADPADGAAVRGAGARGRASRRASSTWSSGRAAPAVSGSSSTRTWRRSRSPARPRSAARSPRAPPDDQAGDARARRKVARTSFSPTRTSRRPPRQRRWAVFGNAGQDCCARSRILVEAARWTSSWACSSSAVKALRVGDPLDEATADGAADLRRPARDRRLVPGRRPCRRLPRQRPEGPGFWFAPTVLCPVAPTRASCARRSSGRSPR